MSTDRAVMLTRAADMRRAPTEPERRLWAKLRASQLGGYKFRRQATIHGCIVDFFCPLKSLVVEIDGDTHDPEYDLLRDTRFREELELSIVRFGNRDVIDDMDGVLERLLSILVAMPDRWPGNTTPNPSSEEEGRKRR